jgi:hypothetical protein
LHQLGYFKKLCCCALAQDVKIRLSKHAPVHLQHLTSHVGGHVGS